MVGDYSEDSLVEQPAIELFQKLGWHTADCFHEFDQIGGSFLGRETKGDVILKSRLLPALEKLNPNLPFDVFNLALDELTRDRSAMSPAHANRKIYDLLKNGVKVNIPNPDGEGEMVETVRVIDWDNQHNNDFFLASQFWVTGEMYTRRADLVGFINGIPVVLFELKATHRALETAYRENLTDYKDTIPHLFWYNQLIILSNGSQSKIGSATASWEHFCDWKKINSEGEEGLISLETMIRGACERSRLLDLIENFTLFMESKGGLVKLVAKNHQYLGVTNALEAFKEIGTKNGRLGVFWHTQGSGKSVSMIFFSQKILRKMPGNWTFVIVTDRKELDDQIYKNFVNAGAVTEEGAHASCSEHLRELLREDHRFVFTLIHKFHTEKGKQHPVLSERRDIIVITDEAHRSQYDALAANMRAALPNASFIAFTGTPLIVGEEKTREVFGDYVSIYNFRQSTDDRATVPLYYENRKPELQLTNENLNEDMQRLLEEAELDEDQEKKLEREFAREYHLITRDDRLEKVAEDIADHFMGRGFRGKAMVVSIDKATAVRMYDKVRKHWSQRMHALRDELAAASANEKADIEEKLRYMQETDMAVVVSQAQNEIADMRKKDVDIAPHRKRMMQEDLDEKFKDENNPFRIVFVCAMWMTGFDVPCCSTIYLDKPMRNHTLMQTIARANRVFGQKKNGLIVDYVGVFRSLEKALAIYGTGAGGGVREGDNPIKDKAALVEELKKTIDEATKFCRKLGISFPKIHAASGFEKGKLLQDAAAAIMVNDETKQKYLTLANAVSVLYKAILPDPTAQHLAATCLLLDVIARTIRSLIIGPGGVDISDIMQKIEDLLDRSIASGGYVIADPLAAYGKDRHIDLSKIDFEALKKQFEKSRKQIEAERLRGLLNAKLKHMLRLNRSRMDYYQRFQEMIKAYNDGSLNVDEFFKRLVDFAQALNEEEKRGVAEQLNEEELAIFDLLTKPDMKFTKKEEQAIKKAARELLETLKRDRLVLDWRKRQQSRADVRLAIDMALDHALPPIVPAAILDQKCDLVYQHIYDSYYGQGQSIYAAVA